MVFVGIPQVAVSGWLVNAWCLLVHTANGCQWLVNVWCYMQQVAVSGVVD